MQAESIGPCSCPAPQYHLINRDCPTHGKDLPLPGWRDRDHTSHLDLRAVGGNGAFASVVPFLDRTLEPQWRVRVGLRARPGATIDDAKRLAEFAAAALVAAGVFTAPAPAWIENAPDGEGVVATLGHIPALILCSCLKDFDRSTARPDCPDCKGNGECEVPL